MADWFNPRFCCHAYLSYRRQIVLEGESCATRRLAQLHTVYSTVQLDITVIQFSSVLYCSTVEP
jgi:hypothetical protein